MSLLPGPLKLGVVVHVRFPSMGEIKLLHHLQKIIIITLGSLRNVMANMLGCSLAVSEFELQPRY